MTVVPGRPHAERGNEDFAFLPALSSPPIGLTSLGRQVKLMAVPLADPPARAEP